MRLLKTVAIDTLFFYFWWKDKQGKLKWKHLQCFVCVRSNQRLNTLTCLHVWTSELFIFLFQAFFIYLFLFWSLLYFFLFWSFLYGDAKIWNLSSTFLLTPWNIAGRLRIFQWKKNRKLFWGFEDQKYDRFSKFHIRTLERKCYFFY